MIYFSNMLHIYHASKYMLAKTNVEGK